MTTPMATEAAIARFGTQMKELKAQARALELEKLTLPPDSPRHGAIDIERRQIATQLRWAVEDYIASVQPSLRWAARFSTRKLRRLIDEAEKKQAR